MLILLFFCFFLFLTYTYTVSTNFNILPDDVWNLDKAGSKIGGSTNDIEYLILSKAPHGHFSWFLWASDDVGNDFKDRKNRKAFIDLQGCSLDGKLIVW